LSGRSLYLNCAHQAFAACADGDYQSRLGVLGVPLIMVPDSSPRASKGVLVLAWRLCRTFLQRDRSFSVTFRSGGCARAHPPAAEEGFSADETVSATRGPTSGSLALIACPRPSSGDAGEGLVAAASALRSSLLLFSRPERRSLSLLMEWAAASQLEFGIPQAPRCGGCSYPREWNRSSVCNGTLSAGVCSLWLSGPEHPGI
jgi:hypothetical protein